MSVQKSFFSLLLGTDVTRRRTLKKNFLLTGTVALILSIFSLGSAGKFVDIYLSGTVDFYARHFLGKEPTFDDRIKIFALDDPSVSKLGTSDPPLTFWETVIERISIQKPKAIIIDKIFGTIPLQNSLTQEFVERIKRAKTPVFAGAFFSSHDIQGRVPLMIETERYDIFKHFSPSSNSSGDSKALTSLDWLETSEGNFYGPKNEILPAFRDIGHTVYFNYGRVAPFLRNAGHHAMPHLGFLAGDRIEISTDGPRIDGHDVPLDHDGKIPVNLFKQSLWSKTKPLVAIRGDTSKVFSSVREGDIVFIIANAYTGNTAVQETPAGKVHGSFIAVSIINSVLTGNWLTPFNHKVELIWLAAISSAVLATLAGLFCLLFSLILLPFLMILAGVIAFSYFGVVVPWLFMAFSFGVTSLVILIETIRVADKESRKLRTAFRTALPPEELQQILRNPAMLQRDASEHFITIAFIDITGFSRVAEEQTPKAAFGELKEFLAAARSIIHDCHGIVDRTLGDGFICFFGYNYHRNFSSQKEASSQSNHAMQALEAASRIQRLALDRCLANAKSGKPVFPVHIGVNSASVFIGDLGDDEAIDFTLIGHGVNHAKRLEEACEPFKVMFGAVTRDLVVHHADSSRFALRFVKIKHHEEKVEAFEFDPFFDCQLKRDEAMTAYRKFAGLDRKESRYDVPEESTILLTGGTNSIGKLVNFSVNGCAIELSQYFSKGMELEFALSEESKVLESLLKQEKLSLIRGEVRWGRAKLSGNNATYLHGVTIKNLTSDQKRKLFSILRSHLADSSERRKMRVR